MTAVGLVTILAAAGCSGPTELPTDGLQPAIIEFDGKSSIDVPRTATVGQTIQVSVKTWVGGRISRGDTRVTYDRGSIHIEPLDDFGSGNLDHWFQAIHPVAITPTEAGTIAIVVEGRSLPGYQAFSRTLTISVTNELNEEANRVANK
jgi:hypothetical protein